MATKFRPARGGDVKQILALLDGPGDGYGPSVTAGLEPLFMRLIEERALRGPVLAPLARTPESGSIEACALTGFVDLEVGRPWLDNPPEHLVDHVLAREGAGEPLLLRPAAVAKRNAGDGLALLFLCFRVPDGTMSDLGTRTHLITTMLESFRLFHAGYHCPIAFHPQGLSGRGDDSLLRLGFRPLDGGRVWALIVRELEAAPFNMLTALNRRPAPRFGFSPSEQDQLFEAMLGTTDAEIAEALGVSLETVRKRWRSIFDRVSADEQLGLPQHEVSVGRGPEKRTKLLQYLDSHLEELRPYARK